MGQIVDILKFSGSFTVLLKFIGLFQNLSKNNGIVIRKYDKNNFVVIVDKDIYIKKM